MEYFRLLFNHLAWAEHQFLSGIRDSKKAGSVWGMKRGEGRVSKSLHQSWLAKWLVTDDLTKMGMKTVAHPSYSPDLAPCDFCLFPKLRGCCYETIEEMKEAVMKVMDMLTQEDFHGAFQKLLEQYKCIVAGGEYFEGD